MLIFEVFYFLYLRDLNENKYIEISRYYSTMIFSGQGSVRQYANNVSALLSILCFISLIVMDTREFFAGCEWMIIIAGEADPEIRLLNTAEINI